MQIDNAALFVMADVYHLTTAANQLDQLPVGVTCLQEWGLVQTFPKYKNSYFFGFIFMPIVDTMLCNEQPAVIEPHGKLKVSWL